MTKLLVSGLALLTAGCIVAAAGAGAAGAVYVSERGVESELAVPVDRAYEGARQAFQDLGISMGKNSSEQDGSIVKKTLEGSKDDRDVTVTVKTEGSGSHVEVVAKKSPVTWDKDLARRILEKIVAKSS
ncbi:MAG: DUF3568 family protein [Gemmatimonadota bacterium]